MRYLFWIIIIICVPLLFAQEVAIKKETIIKDGVTYTLKTRSSIKAKLMDKVYIKGKVKKIELKDNKWIKNIQ